MTRFSLRTLIVVMLLGGPMLAALVRWPQGMLYISTVAAVLLGIGWLGWREEKWWAAQPTRLQIAMRVGLTALLVLALLCILSMPAIQG